MEAAERTAVHGASEERNSNNNRGEAEGEAPRDTREVVRGGAMGSCTKGSSRRAPKGRLQIYRLQPAGEIPSSQYRSGSL